MIPPQLLPCLDLGVPSPHPCVGLGGAPGVRVTPCVLGTSVPLAQLACAIVLGHCWLLRCRAGQQSILSHWRWILSPLLHGPWCCAAGTGTNGWL